MYSALVQRVSILDFFRSRKEKERRANLREEKALKSKIHDALRKNDPEELHMLLTSDEVQKLFGRIGRGVLFRSLTGAVFSRHAECVEELLKAGAYQCPVDFCRPMTRVIYIGEDRLLKLLLEYGQSPDCKWELPLFLAAHRAELSIFRILLLYGADPDHNGSEPFSLYIAKDVESVLGLCLVHNYEIPFIKLLIQFGANMYTPDIQRILNRTDNEAIKFLVTEMALPRSLMSQCRITIRRLLKQTGKLHFIDQLKIPSQLVCYLQHHKELDYSEKLPRYYEIQAKRECTLGI